MDIKKVRYFIEVVNQKSIIKASSVLNVDQSTISRALRSLEEDLGSTLYIHYDKKFRLTEKGKVAFKYFLKLIQTTEDLRGSLRDPEHEKLKKINICATNGTVFFYLIDAAKEFMKKNKNIKFSFNTSDLVQELDGNTDISIGPKIHGETIENFLLYSYEIKMFASKGYLAEHGHPKTPQDLDHHQLIAYSEKHTSRFMDFDWHLRHGSRNNAPREPFMQVTSSFCLKKAAEDDMGVITFSKPCVEKYCPTLVDIFPDEKGIKIEKYFAYDTKNQNLPSIVLFRDFLADFMRRNL